MLFSFLHPVSKFLHSDIDQTGIYDLMKKTYVGCLGSDIGLLQEIICLSVFLKSMFYF